MGGEHEARANSVTGVARRAGQRTIWDVSTLEQVWVMGSPLIRPVNMTGSHERSPGHLGAHADR